jgi:hypothetical protein
MDLLEIPGYAAAVFRERVVRDASFLPITESIGPFEVLPMTLRQMLLLKLLRSPMLWDETPSPDDLRDFLWLLSPDYTPEPSRAKKTFAKRCRKLFYPPRFLPLFNTEGARRRHRLRCVAKVAIAASIIDRARAYVRETMQDRPPQAVQVNGVGFDPDYYSDGAFFCALFGREFGWSPDQTLSMPVKQVYQFLNEMKQHHGSNVPLCNPSDQVRADWMRQVNSQRKENQ